MRETLLVLNGATYPPDYSARWLHGNIVTVYIIHLCYGMCSFFVHIVYIWWKISYFPVVKYLFFFFFDSFYFDFICSYLNGIFRLIIHSLEWTCFRNARGVNSLIRYSIIFFQFCFALLVYRFCVEIFRSFTSFHFKFLSSFPKIYDAVSWKYFLSFSPFIHRAGLFLFDFKTKTFFKKGCYNTNGCSEYTLYIR